MARGKTSAEALSIGPRLNAFRDSGLRVMLEEVDGRSGEDGRRVRDSKQSTEKGSNDGVGNHISVRNVG